MPFQEYSYDVLPTPLFNIDTQDKVSFIGVGVYQEIIPSTFSGISFNNDNFRKFWMQRSEPIVVPRQFQ